MNAKHLLASALFFASCATANGNDPDASRADARPRADAGGATLADGGGVDSAQAADANMGPANLLITEIVDATLPNGLPKFVELTNIGGMDADLSGYSVGVYSNGNLTLLGDTSVVLAGTLAGGESYVMSFENSDAAGTGTFRTTYGFDPDNFDFAASINGNDVVTLFLADGGGTGGAATGTGADATTVDAYGLVGAGGSPGGGIGQAWEYTDGFANRKPGTAGPAVIFDANQWLFSGPDALEGLDAAGIAAVTSPGSF